MRDAGSDAAEPARAPKQALASRPDTAPNAPMGAVRTAIRLLQLLTFRLPSRPLWQPRLGGAAMSAVLYVSCALGCPAVTGALMWLMMRAPSSPAATVLPDAGELDDVRQELARLEALPEDQRGVPALPAR